MRRWENIGPAGRKRRYIAAAREIARPHLFQERENHPPHATLLGTGANATVRVGETRLASVVVRIAHDDARAGQLPGEHAWLNALFRDDAGVLVPTPLPNFEMACRLRAEGRATRFLPGARELSGLPGRRTVSVFWYIPGRIVGTPTPRDTAEAAILMRKLQDHAETYVPPEGIEPRADVDAIDLARTTDDDGAIRLAEEVLSAGDLFRSVIADYRAWSSGRPRLLLHGDLHPDNLLRTPDGTLAAIDFDDCGPAPALYDLAVYTRELAENGLDAQRDILLGAYGASPEDRRDLALVERFRAAQLLWWVVDNRAEPPFDRYMTSWVPKTLAALHRP